MTERRDYFTIVNGVAKDWVFKEFKYGFFFYLEDEFIGYLFNIHNKWSAVSASSNPKGLRKVGGFASDEDAASYLIEVRDDSE
jgi:hypothetical protein